MTQENAVTFAQIKHRAQIQGRNVLCQRRPLEFFPEGVDVFVVPGDIRSFNEMSEQDRLKFWVCWFAELDLEDSSGTS